jgi:hypothetical protein
MAGTTAATAGAAATASANPPIRIARRDERWKVIIALLSGVYLRKRN